MKFYLAAAFKERDRLREYAKELRAMGHEVTSSWLRERGDPKQEMLVEKDYSRLAQRDLIDINRAERFVIFTVDPTEPIKRGGKHFEAGYAYAAGIKVSVVGPPENIFYQMDDVKLYKDWDEFRNDWS